MKYHWLNTFLYNTIMDEKEKIKKELDALHFERADALLSGFHENDGEEALLKIRALRGLYRFEEAMKVCLEHEGEGTAFDLERAKCLFALGKTKEARSLLETIEPTDKVKLTLAALDGETGDVHRALERLETIREEGLDGLDRMDFVLLQADLYSFEEKMNSSFWSYAKGLELTNSCVPKNWRSLRRMLIYHNMADAYEQMEQEEKALETYRMALTEMENQKKKDPSVTDLASYEIELLLSVANCFSNAEYAKEAKTYLKKAKALLPEMKPRQRDYFGARFHYIAGLIAMNAGQEPEAVFHFETAYHAQRELVKSGKDKREHVARSAYYLASLLMDEKSAKKLQLYQVATPIFKEVLEKEPSFYMASLADMENEQGRLAKTQEEALRHFDQAIEWYEKLLKRNPEDRLAMESLLVTRINRMALDPIRDEEIVKEALKEILTEKDNVPFIYSICAILEEQDHSRTFFSWFHDFEEGLPTEFDA